VILFILKSTSFTRKTISPLVSFGVFVESVMTSVAYGNQLKKEFMENMIVASVVDLRRAGLTTALAYTACSLKNPYPNVSPFRCL
jgi:hypothetical protein